MKLGILFSVMNLYGQSSSDGVTLNIRLKPVQTIIVNTSQKNTELQYLTKEDYNKGVLVTLSDHLAVTSTGGFQVDVVSMDANFTRSGSNDVIPVSEVVVSAQNGSENGLSHNFSNVALSINPESLISSESGGRNLKYNVTYDNTAGSSDKYINLNAGEDKLDVLYKADIIYTITSK